MTYQEALDYLESLNVFGSNLGLVRIKKLLEMMKNPEKKYKTIHIAGTNGKGSTTAMVAAILSASQIKTGMYISPHLDEYTERIVINGEQIGRQAFADAICFTKKYVEQMVTAGLEHPTEFEIITAAAFYYFELVGVEYAVIEVGLGGLLDSTNVIIPEVAVITNVTLEHTDRCGNTVAEIAIHKAGIIKKGIPVVTAAKGDALVVIWQEAYKKTAPLYLFERDIRGIGQEISENKQLVSFHTKTKGNIGRFKINLLGDHQIVNSSLAIMVCMLLAEKDNRIQICHIEQGLSQVKWPARFEIVSTNPDVIIDGAHNVDGAKVLRETLNKLYPSQPIIFVLGILKDKDIKGMVKILINSCDTVLVVPPLSYRAADPQVIARQIQAKHVEVVQDIEAAVMLAKKIAMKADVVCIAGSLYLAGRARQVAYIDN